jgi:hypothetical protein
MNPATLLRFHQDPQNQSHSLCHDCPYWHPHDLVLSLSFAGRVLESLMKTIRHNILETRTVRRNWHGIGREFEEQGQPSLNMQRGQISRFISYQGSQDCPFID